MNVPFETLKGYFDSADQRDNDSGGPYKRTRVGTFVPSPLRHVHVALDYLMRTGATDASGPFLDAGSGDARIVALTSLVHGIPSVGVEYDEELLERSKKHLRELDLLIGRGTPMTILPGDFTDDETYLRAGLRFTDFTTVYNYINNESAIAEKIAKQSHPGTKYILLGAFPVPEYWGLTLEQNLELISDANTPDMVVVESRPYTNKSFIDPNGTYVQVYRR